MLQSMIIGPAPINMQYSTSGYFIGSRCMHAVFSDTCPARFCRAKGHQYKSNVAQEFALTREEVLWAQGSIMGGRIFWDALQDVCGRGRRAHVCAGLLLQAFAA